MTNHRRIARADLARKRELAEWPADNVHVVGFWARGWARAALQEATLRRIARAPASCPVVVPPPAIYLDGAEWHAEHVNPDSQTVVLTNPNWRIA